MKLDSAGKVLAYNEGIQDALNQLQLEDERIPHDKIAVLFRHWPYVPQYRPPGANTEDGDMVLNQEALL